MKVNFGFARALGLASCFALFLSASNRAPLDVLVTIPDLADITREIGGDRVKVTSITRGRENLHMVAAKPSHLVAMNKADMFVQIGLSLETGFVPGLMETAGNAKIRPGGKGFVNVSEGWKALDVPASLSRQYGDLHPQGNPHMNLSPRGGEQMAERIHAALCSNDPEAKSAFDARYEDYRGRLKSAAEKWKAMGEGWRGRKVVVYHQEYNYLADAYGIEIVGNVEERPGIPPTPNHVAALVEQMKKDKVEVILTAIWSNNRQVEEIAASTGARVAELPNQCGGLPGTDTWIGMMDVLHQRVADAFGAAAPR